MEKRKFEKDFSDIAEAHPKMDLEIFPEILGEVNELENEKKKATKTIVARKLKVKRSLINNRVNLLEDFSYLEQKGRNEHGGVRIFLGVEGEKPMFSREDIEKAVLDNTKKLIDKCSENKKVSDLVENEVKQLKVLLKDKKKGVLYHYNKAIEKLDASGLKGNLKYMGLKAQPLNLELTYKGVRVLEKIKMRRRKKASEKSMKGELVKQSTEQLSS